MDDDNTRLVDVFKINSIKKDSNLMKVQRIQAEVDEPQYKKKITLELDVNFEIYPMK